MFEFRARDTAVPQVIFLDAVGTLFGVRDSVGAAYARIAAEFDVNLAVSDIDRAFLQAFRRANRLAFPQADPASIPALEYGWWHGVAVDTFTLAGAFHCFTDFDAFFTRLYAYFASPDPWFVYPDAWPALQAWRDRGIALGIVSNFDSRLYAVLEGLGLRTAFHSISISTEVGAAKPDPRIFARALAKHACPPDRAWHIGDSLSEDIAGATQAGLRAIWVDRDGLGARAACTLHASDRVASLAGVPHAG